MKLWLSLRNSKHKRKLLLTSLENITYSSNYKRNNNEVKVDRWGLTYILRATLKQKY